DRAVCVEHAVLELDVGLRRVHLRRVEEAEDAAQVLLADRGADRAGRGTDHARGDVRERVLAPGAAGPVDGVLQTAGDRAVVLRGHDQDRVGALDVLLEAAAGLGIVGVVVVAVDRQVVERDLAELELLWRELDQRPGQFPVDRFLRHAADQVTDVVGLHRRAPHAAPMPAAGSAAPPRRTRSSIRRPTSGSMLFQYSKARSSTGLRTPPSRLPATCSTSAWRSASVKTSRTSVPGWPKSSSSARKV